MGGKKKDKRGLHFADSKLAIEFAEEFLDNFTNPSFGALSKTEIEHLVFKLLIDKKALGSEQPHYELARKLNVTPAKVRNLIFAWQLRTLDDETKIDHHIREAVRTVRFQRYDKLVAFGVESPLLRFALEARLKKMGIFADSSFSKDLLRLSD